MLLAGHLHLGLSIQLVLCCVLIDSVQSLRDYLLDLYTQPEGLQKIGPANDDQVRGTYLAYGISLDLSSDLKG